MASQVSGDLSKIESGPCKLTYKSVALGHTMGGVKLSIKPELRVRQVDEYGNNVVEMLHQGDDVKVMSTLAEKAMKVVQTVYAFGYSVSAYVWGIGRTPGNKASTLAGDLLIHPLDSGGTGDDVEFWKAIVSDVGDVQFGTFSEDRVFECTFTCMVDESKSNGKLIGQIGAAAG